MTISPVPLNNDERAAEVARLTDKIAEQRETITVLEFIAQEAVMALATAKADGLDAIQSDGPIRADTLYYRLNEIAANIELHLQLVNARHAHVLGILALNRLILCRILLTGVPEELEPLNIKGLWEE